MSKQPVSVVLSRDNLLWLRGQSLASGNRSLSQTLDDLISKARSGDYNNGGQIRSVVGTIEIDPCDIDLLEADSHIRPVFEDK